MPRATVIQNPTAGDGGLSKDRLLALVRDQGHETTYATTDDDLDRALQDPGDLVVVAGGDGTVGRVASRIVGRDIPMAVLPVGTANNVATGLGIAGAPEELSRGWASAAARRLDVGFVRGPWGLRHFVESFGIGLFAHAIPILSVLKKGDDAPSSPEGKLAYDRRGLRALLRDYRARPLSLTLDGEPVAGSFVLVEALNGPLLGPGLAMAPDADPGDGRLDVVLLREEARDALGEWLSRRAGDGAVAPPVERRRVATLSLRWDGEPLHFDGRPWGDRSASYDKVRSVDRPEDAPVEVGLEPGGVPVLAPAR